MPSVQRTRSEKIGSLVFVGIINGEEGLCSEVPCGTSEIGFLGTQHEVQDAPVAAVIVAPVRCSYGLHWEHAVSISEVRLRILHVSGALSGVLRWEMMSGIAIVTTLKHSKGDEYSFGIKLYHTVGFETGIEVAGGILRLYTFIRVDWQLSI